MIQSVHIQNFKSVVDLTLELGTFNVLIGANGCGKSNILEAIAFGAAASADKLDQEFLGSRGIRMTNSEFMFSAFIKSGKDKTINLRLIISDSEEDYYYRLKVDKQGKKWIDYNRIITNSLVPKALSEIFSKDGKNKIETIKKYSFINEEFAKALELLTKQVPIDESQIFLEAALDYLTNDALTNTNLSNYILYSPEQTSLRKFEDTNQIYPLGIKGEGLFQYLKELSLDEKNEEILNEIKECLLLLDWYEDFNLPKNLMSNEFALNIKDKYLNEHLQYFDQRSANEGFLFLLFYATLFISKDTPQFFAIDNIDTSFNPKLCMQVTKTLAALAKKHGKQVIVTTQNPAILDGLDLEDDGQRLFVVRRNEEGHTKAKRIAYKAERNMKLSEVWTNGFIGGLPDNF